MDERSSGFDFWLFWSDEGAEEVGAVGLVLDNRKILGLGNRSS